MAKKQTIQADYEIPQSTKIRQSKQHTLKIEKV